MLRFGGVERCGQAIDCRDAGLDPARVLAAVRDPHDDRVRCPRPGPVHDHVGHVARGRPPSRRAALAAVARSRGVRVPEQAELAAARRELAAHDAAATDPRAARERVAEAAGERSQHRERVARLRGEVQTRREAGLDADDAVERLREAASELSEAATAERAARERLERARERAREGYDARERRLELEDRVGNLERATRAALADAVRPRVERALAALPGGAEDGPHAWTLAAARVAVLAAPVVLTAGPFDAAAAADWLAAPVVRL